MHRARVMLQDELVKRTREKTTSSPAYNDAIEWFSRATNEQAFDHGAAQLALAVAALFTTSKALRQTFLEICKHPEIISPLREEVQQATTEHGWTMSALFKMSMLDSVMKEA